MSIDSALSSSIEPELAHRIAASYADIETKFRLHDYKGLASEAGFFCEGVLMALWFLYDSRKHGITGIEFASELAKLEKQTGYVPDQSKPRQDEDKRAIRDEVIRVYIPRVLRSIYTLRSKKQAVHMRGDSVDYIDALLIEQSCSWVIAELIGITKTIDDYKMLEMLRAIGGSRLPLVERIQGEIALRTKEIDEVQGLLLILASCGGVLRHEEAIRILRMNFPRLPKGGEYRARDSAVAREWVYRSKSDFLSLRQEGWNEVNRVAFG